MKFAFTFVLLGVLAVHFRPPLANPTKPELFDPDLTNLQIEHAPKDARILFLGDSLTERWRFRPELWAQFGSAANLGVGGSKTANLLWLVQSGKLNVFHPRLIVIRIGANDMHGTPGFLERRHPSQQEVERGIDLIVKSLQRQFPEARVIVSPAPLASDLAEDGLHMNDQGYKHWAESIMDTPQS